MIDKTIPLQIDAAAPPLVIDCTEGDTAWAWRFQLYLGGERWTIPAQGEATFTGRKSDGHVFDYAAAISNNEVVVAAVLQMTACPGDAYCIVRVLDTYGKIVAACPVILRCKPNPLSMGSLSESVIAVYDEAADRFGELISVQQQVTNWLDEHITQPSTPVVDSSLSVSGAAADAKETGDQLHELQETVDELNEGGLDLKDDVIENAVQSWLTAHPEATTTVQDGMITAAKLASALYDDLVKQSQLASLSANLSTLATKVNASCLRFTNNTVAVADWSSDTTYTDYPYRAMVPCAGITADYFAQVVFDMDDLLSGNYAPASATAAGGVYIYAAEIPEAVVTIPTIMCWKASNV